MSGTIVFYSPFKRPNVTASSGAPRVSALLVKAIKLAGFDVIVPDLPQTYERSGDALAQRDLRELAKLAGDALIHVLRRGGVIPSAWFTYHCYYKSPDVIGPKVSEILGCPYIIAEASFAAKRTIGSWSHHHGAAARAMAAADALLAMTDRDLIGLDRVPGRRGSVFRFPPFVDCAPFAEVGPQKTSGPVNILAAGSMTDARKIESYRQLFRACKAIPPGCATLTIAGDGSFRSGLEREAQDLQKCGISVTFLGHLPHQSMPEFFASGAIFAWPGVGEAYGLTYLEAQASGVPVVAANFGGVSACVVDGISGILCDPADENGFASALNALVQDDEFRRTLSASARSWTTAERSLPAAARRLRDIIGCARQ